MASPLLSCVLALPRAECRFQAAMTSMTSIILIITTVLSLCNICCADLKNVQTEMKLTNKMNSSERGPEEYEMDIDMDVWLSMHLVKTNTQYVRYFIIKTDTHNMYRQK